MGFVKICKAFGVVDAGFGDVDLELGEWKPLMQSPWFCTLLHCLGLERPSKQTPESCHELNSLQEPEFVAGEVFCSYL